MVGISLLRFSKRGMCEFEPETCGMTEQACFVKQHLNIASIACMFLAYEHGVRLILMQCSFKLSPLPMQVNATKVQRRMRKPRTAAQQAADVVEHVINVGGEDYLETAEHHLSWWQLSMIDVYLALLGLVAAAASLVGGTVWLVLRLCWHMWLSLSRSDQKQKKS